MRVLSLIIAIAFLFIFPLIKVDTCGVFSQCLYLRDLKKNLRGHFDKIWPNWMQIGTDRDSGNGDILVLSFAHGG